MTGSSNIELLENSSVEMTVKVSKKAIQETYDDLVKKYCKTVQLKGFRKGKVPENIMIRMFGDTLLAETHEQIIKKSFEEALESTDKKPIASSTPKLDSEKKIELGKAYSYKVTYDIYPEVQLPDNMHMSYEELKVSVTEEDIERQLKTLQEQNALVVDKKDGVADKKDIVSIDTVELDSEGSEIENTKRESFVFEVGSGYNIYKIDDDIIGIKTNDERILKKKYPEDFEFKELAGREVDLKVKLNSVKEKQLPEIDDELAQDISDKYETLNDLESDIRKRSEDMAAQKVREHHISQILEKIVEGSKIPLPQSMIEQEISHEWHNFIARLGSDEKRVLQQLETEGKSKEDVINEWREPSIRRLNLQLAVSKMVEKEDIQISDEDLEIRFKKEAEQREITVEQIKEQYAKSNAIEILKIDTKNEKLYDKLLENASITKSKKVKFLDLIQGKY